MTEVSHYRISSIFPFDNVNDPGLRRDSFDLCIFEHLEKHIGGHRGVAGCIFGQFINFAIFLLDVLYYESFEIILHFLTRLKYLLWGGFPGNALFFYSSRDHIKISTEDAFLNPDGS
jgi:hypothetical protein